MTLQVPLPRGLRVSIGCTAVTACLTATVAGMADSLQNIGAITVFVRDRLRAKAFYEQVFEVEAISEDEHAVAFRFENLIVNLLEDDPARELIEPAAVADRAAGSSFQLTIWVDDVDAVVIQLAEHGVELLNGPIDRPWGMRTASFTDPDGHIWEVAQGIGLEPG